MALNYIPQVTRPKTNSDRTQDALNMLSQTVPQFFQQYQTQKMQHQIQQNQLAAELIRSQLALEQAKSGQTVMTTVTDPITKQPVLKSETLPGLDPRMNITTDPATGTPALNIPEDAQIGTRSIKTMSAGGPGSGPAKAKMAKWYDPVENMGYYSDNATGALLSVNGDKPYDWSHGEPLALGLQRMPAAQVEKSVQLDTIGNMANRIVENYDSSFVGPFDSLYTNLSQYTPLAQQKAGQFMGALAEVKNTLLQLRSGAVITDGEYSRLIQSLPYEAKNEKDFKAKMDTFTAQYNSLVSSREKRFEDAGYRKPGPSPKIKPLDIGTGWTDADEKRLQELEAKAAGGN